MSRSKGSRKTSKVYSMPGYEYWSRRPLSNAHGAHPCRAVKRLTHRLERQAGKRDVREETP